MTAEKDILQKSSRDLGQTRAGLAAWLAGKLPGGSAHEVTELTAPSTSQSSETLFFTAAWHDGSVLKRELRSAVAAEVSTGYAGH